jgi:hypothetical protein
LGPSRQCNQFIYISKLLSLLHPVEEVPGIKGSPWSQSSSHRPVPCWFIRRLSIRKNCRMPTSGRQQSLLIHGSILTRELIRLKASRRWQGRLVHRGAARRRLGRLKASRRWQGRQVHMGAARRRLGRLKASRRWQDGKICILSWNHQNYLMNRSRGYSKNFFSYILVCYPDLSDPTILFIPEDFRHTGQLVRVTGLRLVL